MKTKNTPQTMTQEIIKSLLKYLPLLIALGIVGAWIWFVGYTSKYPVSRQILFFYPLVQLDGGMLFGFIMTGLIVLHGFAWSRGVNLILVCLSIIGMLGVVCLFGLGLWLLNPSEREIQSISSNGSVYRLIYVNRIFGWDNPMGQYNVLECDDSGHWCQLKAVSYTEEYHYKHCPLPPEKTWLGIDDMTQELVLHIGNETYSTSYSNNQKWPHIDCAKERP